MSIEIEQSRGFRRSRETRDVGAEYREQKENEGDLELKKAAAMERADILAKEVKNSKKQMQNILLHIQQVTAAIAQLRRQLAIASQSDDPISVKQDKEMVEELRNKIQEYKAEIIKMRDDLVREQVARLKDGIGVGLSAGELEKRAAKMVDDLIIQIIN